jgi:hypothetical protein
MPEEKKQTPFPWLLERHLVARDVLAIVVIPRTERPGKIAFILHKNPLFFKDNRLNPDSGSIRVRDPGFDEKPPKLRLFVNGEIQSLFL